MKVTSTSTVKDGREIHKALLPDGDVYSVECDGNGNIVKVTKDGNTTLEVTYKEIPDPSINAKLSAALKAIFQVLFFLRFT